MQPAHYVYVDNAGVFTITLRASEDLIRDVSSGMEKLGLTMHEVEVTNKKLECLGVEINLQMQCTRLSDK
eukprot:6368370-Karenia_brevis.AAC.1